MSVLLFVGRMESEKQGLRVFAKSGVAKRGALKRILRRVYAGLILIRQEWLKGLCEPSDQNMEALRGAGREERLGRGWAGQKP